MVICNRMLMEGKTWRIQASSAACHSNFTITVYGVACLFLTSDRYQNSSHVSHPPTSEHPLSRWSPGDQLYQKVTALFMQPNYQHIKQFTHKEKCQCWSETKLDPWLFFKYNWKLPEMFQSFWTIAIADETQLIMWAVLKLLFISKLQQLICRVMEDLTDFDSLKWIYLKMNLWFKHSLLKRAWIPISFWTSQADCKFQCIKIHKNYIKYIQMSSS